MKKSFAILVLITAASLLLTACTGVSMAASWPGLAVQDNTAYIAFGNGIQTVDITNGAPGWRIPDKADPAKQFYATPTFLDGQVLVGDYTNTLHSLDKTSGAEKWVFADAKGRYIAGAVMVGNLILAPSVDDTLYALDQNGRVQWKFTAKNDLWASPVSDGKVVYLAGMDRMLYAVRLSDGTQIWSTDLGAAILSAPALGSNGVIYAATLDKKVIAVEASGGSIVWSADTEGALWSSPVFKDGAVFIGDVAKKFYAFDAKSGAALWKLELPGGIFGAAALIPNGLVVVTDTGDVTALSFKGEKLWSQRINGKLYTTPVVSGDKIFIAVKDSEKLLFAYDFSGKELWSVAVPK